MMRRTLATLGGVVAGLLIFGLLHWAGVEPVTAIAVLVAVTLTVGRVLEFRWRQSLTEGGAMATEPPAPPVPAPPPEDIDQFPLSALADAALAIRGWRVIAANDAAFNLFGSRIIGTDLRQTVRHPDVIETVRLAMETPVPMLREIASFADKEDLRLRVAPAGPQKFLLTFADVSHARLVQQMRADFVANASHELRTPLANLIGFIETLQGPAANDPAAHTRFLSIMAREADRMTRLIDDLLSLSRIETNRYVRPTTATSLKDLVDEVGRSFHLQVKGADRSLVMDVPADLPPVVADHDQIMQVWHNLITNALKYGRPGTPIEITARLEPHMRPGPMVRVSVRDRGEGISPEHLPRLTERFYRVDAGRSNALGGTGLGLSIVKHIVERHRGRLEIDSVPGEGTTVSFALPVTSVDEVAVTKA